MINQVERIQVGLCLLVIGATSFIHAGAQEPEEQQVFRIEAQIYTFRATEIGYTVNGSRIALSTKGEVSIPLPGDQDLHIGDTRVQFGGKTVKINGKDGARRTDDLRLLATPTVMTVKGQKAVISIQDTSPIQYMERVDFKDEGFASKQFEESLKNRPDGDPLLELINIDFRELDLKDVIPLLAEKGGINVILHSSVDDDLKVTVNLKNIPLGRALAIVLRMKGLGLVGEDNLYRVVPYGSTNWKDLGEECCYSIREIDNEFGINLSVEILDNSKDEEISLRTAFTVTIVEKRKPLPGVTLDVGKPVLTSLRTHADLKVQEGNWTGVLSTTESGTCTLALLKVTKADAIPERSEEEEAETTTDEPTASSALEDLSDAEQSVRRYAIEARFFKYEGRLDEDRVRALRETRGVETGNEDVFRLVDGILPARRGDIDLARIDSLAKREQKDITLLSVSRGILWDGRDMRDEARDFIEDQFRMMLPSGRDPLVSTSEIAGMVGFADIISEYFAYDERTVNNGTETKSDVSILQVYSGAMMLTGVGQAEGPGQLDLDVYCQFSTLLDDTNGVAKDRDEVIARFSFTDFRDRRVVSDGGTVCYLHSVSDKEHWIVALAVTQIDGPASHFRLKR